MAKRGLTRSHVTSTRRDWSFDPGRKVEKLIDFHPLSLLAVSTRRAGCLETDRTTLPCVAREHTYVL